MVRRKFSVKGLKPEKYDGFNIYFQKDERGVYAVRIQEDASGQFVSSFVHAYDGDYFDRKAATKQGALEVAKQKIDDDLSGKKIRVVKKGDLFYDSWGYDQTNNDFVMVTEVSPSGKTVKARRVRVRTVDSTGFYDSQVPVREPYGEAFRLQVTYYDGEPSLRGSYPYGGFSRLEDASRMGSFSLVTEGRSYAQTDTRFGH